MVWLKRKIELLRKWLISCYLTQVWGCMAIVRFPDPKRKTLGEKGIDYIFVGYAKHSKAYMFYVIEPNDSVSINSIIESRDAIFDDNHFSSLPRPKDIIPNSVEPQRDDHYDDLPSETSEPHKAIHNLVIHQMDVKTAFLNGDLEEVYMEQPEGFVMPGNEHKVCKLVKSFIFDDSSKGVIICLYVDDLLIFGTNQNQVDKTKKFLSSWFSMKDMVEADIILDCSPVSTPMDPVEKLKPNTVGKLSRFTSNPSRQHWQEITRVFKYLKGTMNYGLSYVGYPSMLEAYLDVGWINHVEDSSSTCGWVFLLGGRGISWAPKKQTCITSSTMEYEFVALAVVGKETE
nr:hypothetical protein [Tanacetum cinerariifolium]